jgi:hypothetical protein
MTACVIGMKASWKRPGSRYRLAQDEEPQGRGGEARGGRGLGMSYLSTTDTVTLTSDTPAILTIVPETWTVNSS